MLHSTTMVLSPPFNQKRFFMSALAYLKLELRDLSVGQAPDNYQFSHRLLVKVIVDLKLVTWCYVITTIPILVLHVPLMQLLSSKLLPHSSWWSFTIITYHSLPPQFKIIPNLRYEWETHRKRNHTSCSKCNILNWKKSELHFYSTPIQYWHY